MKPRKHSHCFTTFRFTDWAAQAATIGCALIISTGCQSGFSGFKKPDFGKLAFWKKDELQLASRSDDIPPPSAHFNPERGETMDAKANDELKASVEAIIAEAKRNKAKQGQETIRAPYSLDSIDAKIGGADTKTGESNDFVMNQKLNEIQSKANRALAKTEDAVKKSGDLVNDSANSVAGWKNDMQATGEKRIQDASGMLKAQADQTISQTENAVNSLASTAEDRINNSISRAQTSIDNSFQPKSSSTNNSIANAYPTSAAKSSDAGSVNEKSSEQIATNIGPSDNSFSSDAGFMRSPTGDADVQQSSFNSSGNGGSLLQPVASNGSKKAKSPATTSGTPSKYPSTSFGEIQATNQTDPGRSTDIPPQLLRGTGSYSPGSTTPLRPANSGN